MYFLILKKKAEKEIQALPKREQQRITAAFNVLRKNPFEGKQLEGKYKGAWTFRVWPYRIIYTIHQKTVTVVVLRVGHRQGIYKK